MVGSEIVLSIKKLEYYDLNQYQIQKKTLIKSDLISPSPHASSNLLPEIINVVGLGFCLLCFKTDLSNPIFFLMHLFRDCLDILYAIFEKLLFYFNFFRF